MTASWDEFKDEEIQGSPVMVRGGRNIPHHTSTVAFWTQKRMLSEIIL